MSKLNIDQKTIRLLLTDKHSDFLIPDYQRPYAWGEDECAMLWDDLFSFAFPNDNCDAFDSSADEYFLGPIVTFKNSAGQLEIIDGQQRLTTIMLLLRAFYDKFANMKDKQPVKVRESIAGCVWKTDEFDEPDMGALKIDSEVASDADKGEFLEILRHGSVAAGARSAYARNYAFFAGKIADMASEWPTNIALLAARILNSVILLPIKAESQDTALRIFSTLNDRGLPLADADIFKSQFYKHFSAEAIRTSSSPAGSAWRRRPTCFSGPRQERRSTSSSPATCTTAAPRKASATPRPRACATSTARAATRSSSRTRRSTTWRPFSTSGDAWTLRRGSPGGC